MKPHRLIKSPARRLEKITKSKRVVKKTLGKTVLSWVIQLIFLLFVAAAMALLFPHNN